MNRIIKFRVWDNLTKQMLFEDFHLLGEVMSFSLIDQWIREHKEGKGLLERYNDMVFQQYTGIQDSKGVKVYDGDILREKMTEEMAANGGGASLDVVRFSGGAFLIDCNPIWDYLSSNNPDVLEDFEVIGNLYENPELLK